MLPTPDQNADPSPRPAAAPLTHAEIGNPDPQAVDRIAKAETPPTIGTLSTPAQIADASLELIDAPVAPSGISAPEPQPVDRSAEQVQTPPLPLEQAPAAAASSSARQLAQLVVELSPPALATESVGVARSTHAASHAIHLERPAAGLTLQGVHVVSGRVSGPSIRNVSLSLNGVQHLLDVWGNRFHGEIALRPGDNQIWAVAMGASGPLAEETVRIEYTPPPPSREIRIIRPVTDDRLDPAGPGVLLVEGTAQRGLGDTVAVVCNELSIPATVKEGRFHAVVPAFHPSVTIRAEGRDATGTLHSEPVTISLQQPQSSTGFLVLYLPTESPASQVRVWLSRRENPSDANTPAPFTILKPPPGFPTERGIYVLPFPQADSGVFTLVLQYRLAPGDHTRDGWAALYVAGRERYRVLRLGPFRLQGEGQATLAQFLLPQQVFWEEDHWFTGSVQGAETVTKFRYADRISWVERKVPPDIPISP